MFGETLWHPERSTKMTIQGLENPHTRSDVELAWRGLFRSFVRVGRRPGSYKIPNFPERLHKAYNWWIEEYGERPAQEDIAAELGISRKTLGRQLEVHEIPWPLDVDSHY